MEREYEFFVTTDEPQQPEGASRGLIRRLVMRNFFETKASNPGTTSSESNSASTVQAKTQLKSRFRLAKPGQTRTTSKASTRNKDVDKQAEKEEEGGKKPKRLATTRKLFGKSDASQSTTKSARSLTGSRKGSPAETELAETSEEKPRLLLKVNPGSHRFDPFDVLPVPGTFQFDRLFKLYKSGSRANAIAVNARNTWWPFISQDAGLLHATLATWALYGMLVRGMDDLAVEKLRHKNEAIKQINTKIGCPTGQMSDELVGTVLTLASFENLVGAYDAAQLHLQALKRIVDARGGLYGFGHNDGLIRGIIWVDFHSAAAFHHAPSFPRIRIDPGAPSLPDALLEEAAFTSPTSLLQLSLASIDCFNIFYRLHRLALAATNYWLPKVDRLTLSNLLYDTEYIILSLPDRSRDFLDFDLESKTELVEDYEERASMADSASVVEALLAAVQIFIYASLREIPPKAKIFSILLDRARVAMDRPRICMLDTWRNEKNLNILLWVLVVVCSLAPSWGGRACWIGKLAEVVKELRIHSEDELLKSLQGVAWTDIFFGDVLPGVWEDVTRYQTDMEIFDALLAEERDGNAVLTEEREGEEGEFLVGGHLLLQRPLSLPMEFESGRWRVNGWYV